jgi:hypothetical protein
MWTDIDKLKYMTIAHVAFNKQDELHILVQDFKSSFN